MLPYAPRSTYGVPAELRRFVDAAFGAALAVLIDVVYNHLGPQGNHLADFGPCFTNHYRTPWGQAMNFDGADSDLNDARLVRNRERGGFGLDAHCSDDFHHAPHVTVTGERHGSDADHDAALAVSVLRFPAWSATVVARGAA